MVVDRLAANLFESLGIGIALYDSSQHSQLLNATAARILGVDDEGRADQHPVSSTTAEARSALSQLVVAAFLGESTESVVVCIENEWIRAEATRAGVPTDGETGVLLAMVSQEPLRPVAPRALHFSGDRPVQRDLNPAEVSSFAFHDLKSPLTAILMSADALASRPFLHASDLQAFQDIGEAARMMRRIICDHLDLYTFNARGWPLRLVRVGVEALIAETVLELLPLARLHAQQIESSATEELSTVVDPAFLRRVLQNLLSNCIKFNAPSETVTISAAKVPGGVLIRVADRGNGVPVECREQVFEGHSLHPDRSDGHGLGLRFCRSVIEQHGGRIWVEDNEPRGARFCIELPDAPGRADVTGSVNQVPQVQSSHSSQAE